MQCTQYQLNPAAALAESDAAVPTFRFDPTTAAAADALVLNLIGRQRRLCQQEASPIGHHLADYRHCLLTRDSAKYVRETVRRIRLMLRLCRASRWDQLSSSAVQIALGKMMQPRPRRKTLGPATINHYLNSLKGFGRWMVSDGRAAHSPCQSVRRLNPHLDIRRQRRPLSPQEAQRLIAAASAGPTIAGICGAERAMTYLVAFSTGLRSGELQSLTAANFVLDGPDPIVRLETKFSKAKRPDPPIPLRADVAASLRAYVAARSAMRIAGIDPDPRLFRRPKMNPMRSFRQDLAAAGIEYCVNGCYADFHAQRHSFVSELIQTGATPKQVQELARHHDPRLTLAVYAHASRPAQRDALERLAALTSAEDAKAAMEQMTDESRRESFTDAADGVTWIGQAHLMRDLGISPASADLLCEFDGKLPPPRTMKFADGPRRFWPKEALSRWVESLRQEQVDRASPTSTRVDRLPRDARVGLDAARALGFTRAFLMAHSRFTPAQADARATPAPDAALGRLFDGTFRPRIRGRHITLERTWLAGELLDSRAMRGKPIGLPVGAVLTADHARRIKVPASTLLNRIRAAGIPQRTCTRIKRNGFAQRTSYLTPADIERLASTVTADGEDRRFVTCAQAASIAGVNSGQITHAANIRKLATNGQTHRRRRIDRDSLEVWIAWRSQKLARRQRREMLQAAT